MSAYDLSGLAVVKGWLLGDVLDVATTPKRASAKGRGGFAYAEPARVGTELGLTDKCDQRRPQRATACAEAARKLASA